MQCHWTVAWVYIHSQIHLLILNLEWRITMLSQENKNNVCFNVIEMNKQHVFFCLFVFQKTIFSHFPYFNSLSLSQLSVWETKESQPWMPFHIQAFLSQSDGWFCWGFHPPTLQSLCFGLPAPLPLTCATGANCSAYLNYPGFYHLLLHWTL